LHGWGNTADRLTPLASGIGPSDTTFTVTDPFGQAVGISPGAVEIDTEQLYVKTVDQSTGVATLAAGFGRGFNGTTAVAHAAGAEVVSRPRFPRINIFNNINAAIGGLFPDLFAVQTAALTITYPSNTYTLPGPARAQTILDIQWQHPLGDWLPIFSYDIDKFDGTLRLGSLLSPITIGRPLRVIYTIEPSPFAASTDDFVAVTGLPASCADVVEFAVLAKMVAGLDISRAQLTSIEQSDRSRVVPPNAGITVGKYLMAEYQDRLRNEADSLRRQYPPRLRRKYGN
jgi:hypothetical protein